MISNQWQLDGMSFNKTWKKDGTASSKVNKIVLATKMLQLMRSLQSCMIIENAFMIKVIKFLSWHSN